MKLSVVIARFNEDLSWLSIFDKIAEEMNHEIKFYMGLFAYFPPYFCNKNKIYINSCFRSC